MDATPKEPFWRVCERAWGAWLASHRWTVTHLHASANNAAGTGAPLMVLSTGQTVVAPDYVGMKGGRTQYWEVKSRVRPLTNQMTGTQYHWVSEENFNAYYALQQVSGVTVTVVVCEAETAYTANRWLSIDINEMADHAVIEYLPNEDGTQQQVVCWPVSVMIPIQGPVIRGNTVELDIFNSVEDQQTPISAVATVAGLMRKKRATRLTNQHDTTVTETTRISNTTQKAVEQILSKDHFAALDAFRLSLGIPILPRYSVLLIAEKIAPDFLELLHYGIRLFLITGKNQTFAMSENDQTAFREARLLEWAQIPDFESQHTLYSIDGVIVGERPLWYDEVLEKADRVGGFNAKQYQIVHAKQDADILVTAGAGTGKTETMSERLMFLLSTVSSSNSFNATASNNELLLSEVALVTFTRESAREMRSRIARTLVLRQRLCAQIVHPIMAWIIQLGSAHISTLHSFAKRIIQMHGMHLGISQNFTVSTQQSQFEELLHDELSEQIIEFIDSHGREVNIPEFEWVKFMKAIWQGLENNGIPLIKYSVTESDGFDSVDWGDPAGDSVNSAIASIVRSSITRTRQLFAEHCQREQAIPTNQLVPTALAAVGKLVEPPAKRFRFIFVDEFQDTDPLQMQMVLSLRQKLNAQLFVVGDPKQGIYRFRGAEGNAFDVLRKNVLAYKMTPFVEYTLTLNFRTDGVLLDSLHTHFTRWGQQQTLVYGPEDRLRANPEVARFGEPLEIVPLRTINKYPMHAALIVQQWRAESSHSSIAVLCRTNSHAKEVQRAIRSLGGQCDLLVGGDFYITPAVRELRVFLEAVVNPHDDAAVLEVCETRWAGRILDPDTKPPASAQDSDWGGTEMTPMTWVARMASLSNNGNLAVDDLDSLRKRLLVLKAISKHMSGMSFVVEMQRFLQPEICSLSVPDDETERQRYIRCFTHLLTLMDTQFADSPATLIAILEWLKVQIGVNRQEDEPVDAEAMAGKTTALTVHKSKGLEFDYVLLPHTWSPFEHPKYAKHIVTVIQRHDGRRSILWRWRPGRRTDSPVYTNVSDDDSQWTTDAQETYREETRLLYVSMTRARKKLKIVVNPRSANGKSWSGLLS